MLLMQILLVAPSLQPPALTTLSLHDALPIFLLAIAIPTFLGARSRAQDRAAQSNLRNALTAEKTYYTDTEGDHICTPATGGPSMMAPDRMLNATPATDIDVKRTANNPAAVCL